MKPDKFDDLIIDVSNLFHRAYNASGASKKKTSEESTSQALTSFISIIRRIDKEFAHPQSHLWFLFDNNSSVSRRREDLDPDYKANREPSDTKIREGIDALFFALMYFSDRHSLIKIEEREADDLVSPLLGDLPTDHQCILFSNDLDWSVHLSDRVFWAKYDTGSKEYEVWSLEEFRHHYGFNPGSGSLCLYKSIRGDESDNIPIAVKNIPEKTVRHICNNYDSVEELLESMKEDDFISDKWVSEIYQNRARLFLNFKLVSPLPVSLEELREGTNSGKFNARVLKNIYDTLGVSATQFDPRVLQFFPQASRSEKDFFTFQKIPRA